jgi:ABC-type sugar transport system ATPase subunit
MIGPYLEIRGVKKSFPSVQALKGVDFDAYSGEVLALIGANGAGKSTLMNILGGVMKQDAGSIRIGGEQVALSSPLDATAIGISFVHQEMALLPSLTVAENMFITSFPRSKAKLIDIKKAREDGQRILDSLTEGLNPKNLVRDLSTGDQQMVEIARALLSDPRLIIFDEPTSSLSDTEKQRLFAVIKRLKSRGATIIYITHLLDEVFSLADRAVVLRNGEVAGSSRISDLSYDEIVRLMIGSEEIDRYFHRDSTTMDNIAIRVSGIESREILNDISFQLKKGEIVGLWGLLGSGRTELIRALVGLDRIDRGRIEILRDGVLVERTPKQVLNEVGLITENRRDDGLLLPLSLRENMSLANIRSLIQFWPFVDRKKEIETIQRFMERLRIKASDYEQAVGTLSGGNQQKVVVGRWLQREPKIFFMDEPTRGLDVGAKSEIYRIIDQLAREGATILLVSSDIDELTGLSDRYLVLHQGELVAELPHGTSKNELMIHATGAGKARTEAAK